MPKLSGRAQYWEFRGHPWKIDATNIYPWNTEEDSSAKVRTVGDWIKEQNKTAADQSESAPQPDSSHDSEFVVQASSDEGTLIIASRELEKDRLWQYRLYRWGQNESALHYSITELPIYRGSPKDVVFKF